MISLFAAMRLNLRASLPHRHAATTIPFAARPRASTARNAAITVSGESAHGSL
jgi:hypothetical protein